MWTPVQNHRGDVGPAVDAGTVARSGRREFQPSVFGKLNTLAQITAVAVVMLHQLIQDRWVVFLRDFALWATMVLTVVSGLHYAWTAARRTSAHPPA